MKVNLAWSEVGLKRESESEPDVDNIPFRLNDCPRVRVLAELSEALPIKRKSSTQSLKVKTFFSWEPLPPVAGNQSDKDLPALERHQQASSGP